MKNKVRLVYDDTGVTVTYPARNTPFRQEEKTVRKSDDEINQALIGLAKETEAIIATLQDPPDWKWDQLQAKYPKTFKRLSKAAETMLAIFAEGDQ